MRFSLSRHAELELQRRQIPPELLQATLDNPEQVLTERGGRKAYQSWVEMSGTVYLLRAIVKDNTDPAIVITVYRTRKIEKYWSKS